jgi:hypothetical protein
MKEKKWIDSHEKQGLKFSRKCPFVDEPFDYCYCSSMDSLAVQQVMRYCGGTYEECHIYKNKKSNKTE